MRRSLAIDTLHKYDKAECFVFTRGELASIFYNDNPEAFAMGLRHLVNDRLLSRPCRNVYVNHNALSISYTYILEHVASALRRDFHNYVSLESALSEYGVVSRVPMRLTVMTTGRRGSFNTEYGVIEFTHTSRDRINIMRGSIAVPDRPMRIAHKRIAWRDFKRAGRDVKLINLDELEDDINDWTPLTRRETAAYEPFG